MDIQKQVDAMAQEFANQRAVLGDRAVHLAAVVAQKNAEIEELKKRISELEQPKTPA